MQKLLTHQNQDQSLTEMARFPKLCKNPIWNVMLHLRAVSKVAVKFLLIHDQQKRSSTCIALFIKARAMTFYKQSFMNFCFII